MALLDHDPDARAAWGGEPAAFVGWIRDWREFLVHCACCGGYDTDPEWSLPEGTPMLEWTEDRGEACGACQHFDPNFISRLGSGHCALRSIGRVHEHQHCLLEPPAFTKSVPVVPAPLGERE